MNRSYLVCYPMNIWYRIWIYLLPLPMWLAEYFMRTVMHNPEVNDFFPSSLTATALGLLIPVLAPSAVRQKPGLNIPLSMLLVNRTDETIRQIGMMTLFTGTLLWPATVFLSVGGQWPNGWIGEQIDQKFWIGAILYPVAFGLNEWKERMKWICAS